MFTAIAICLTAYLAGSINFAVVVLRLTGQPDPRSRDSGNPGAFNVYRKHGVRLGAPVLLLDIGRAALVAVVGLRLMSPGLVPLAGLFLVLGNRYPVFHRFQGGKGVGNYLGFTAVVAPWFALGSLAAWVASYKIGGEAFLGSFAMVTVLAAGNLFRCGFGEASIAGTVVTLALIVHGHRSNAARWRKRRETRSAVE